MLISVYKKEAVSKVRFLFPTKTTKKHKELKINFYMFPNLCALVGNFTFDTTS
jgi:hypothetical protein